jgi:hypothetical protein
MATESNDPWRLAGKWSVPVAFREVIPRLVMMVSCAVFAFSAIEGRLDEGFRRCEGLMA